MSEPNLSGNSHPLFLFFTTTKLSNFAMHMHAVAPKNCVRFASHFHRALSKSPCTRRRLFSTGSVPSFSRTERRCVRNGCSGSPTIQMTRCFSSQPFSTSTSPSPSTSYTSIYTGPLTRTFRNLKLFSLSSLAMATSLTPFMFIIESSLPFGARCALAATAVTTSGISTMLVGWAGSPYVVGIEGVKESADGKEKEEFDAVRIETRSLLLQPVYTTVYDPAFLGDTRRPLAKWELVERLDAPQSEPEGSRGGEETVAETCDKTGKVLGRWIVQWDTNGKTGVCRGTGNIQRFVHLAILRTVKFTELILFNRHFNVHEELLPPGLRTIV